MAVAKRDAVLEAALELFSAHTFAGTPVPLIAARARVGAGTIYRYFADKEDLGNAVYRLWAGELLRRLTEEAPAAGAVRAAVEHWWQAVVTFATDHPDAYAFLNNQQHDAYLDAESLELATRLDGVALALVRRGQRRGEVRKGDPRLLVALLTGAVSGLARAAAAGELRLTRRVLADAEQAAWDLLAA